MSRIKNLICFDLEGPLAPQDNAYELMKSIPDGGRVFEVISRYDDLVTLEGKEGYEPGDTLALIVPFLVLHNITEDNITTLADQANLTGGAADLVAWLKSRDWAVFCISTSYEQYAHRITQRVGIPLDNVACTSLPLDRLNAMLCKDDARLLEQAEKEMLTMEPETGDDRIKQRLDRFFRHELPGTSLGKLIEEVKPRGGRRKVAALETFAGAYAQPLSGWVVVGDSITDYRMLNAVEQAGGLAIAFNSNEYALPYATAGLASTFISDMTAILEAWEKGQRGEVEKLIKEKEKGGGKEDRNYFHWLSGRKDINEIINIHKYMRRLARGEAGKLG